MMLRYMGWVEAADIIIQSMDATIEQKTVTYDFARLNGRCDKSEVQRICIRNDREYVTQSLTISEMTSSQPTGVDAAEAAAVVVAGFVRYNNDFRKITQRAKRRFELRDWASNQNDAVERIELYELAVGHAVTRLREYLADNLHDKNLWIDIKEEYSSRIREKPDTEFFKTYFSSVTRRIFSTIGVDPFVEYVAIDVMPGEYSPGMVDARVYRNRGETQFLFDEILSDYDFAVPYRDVDQTNSLCQRGGRCLL